MSDTLLSLNDFDLSIKMDIADRAEVFKAFIKLMDGSMLNNYFVKSSSNIGHRISVTKPLDFLIKTTQRVKTRLIFFSSVNIPSKIHQQYVIFILLVQL